jgi:nicotinamidase-related amidase
VTGWSAHLLRPDETKKSPREFRPLLVVIDVQNGFVNAGSAHIVAAVADLAAKWRAAGGALMFTRYRNYPGSPFERLIGWHGLHSDEDTALAPGVADLAAGAPVVDKNTYSVLAGDPGSVIADGGFTDLFLCGIATDSCVLASAVAAFDAGLTPWVVADACASSATSAPPEECHRAALMLITRMIGGRQVITSAEALAMLTVHA